MPLPSTTAGITLHELRRFEEALASYDQALAAEPDRAGTFNNRGYALQEASIVSRRPWRVYETVMAA